MNELPFLSAIRLTELIRQGEVSSVEVVEAHLARIAAVNPRINAVVQVAPDVLDRARAADAALATDRLWGPLHGVPFTAKDNLDTAGVVTAVGIEERRGFVPQGDAVVVARLKAAGAILLGKTNVPPQGGGGMCENPVYGRTNNPYDLARTPAGSSGGEAAAIAAGLSPLGLGSDSGGSLRLPAHYCGVATLKPTTGRVPNTGAYLLPGGLTDPRSQIGPMARFVCDLWPAFAAIAGVDWCDSGVIPMPLGDPILVTLPALHVALMVDDGVDPPSTETAATVEAAGRCLESLGMRVETSIPEAIRRSWDVSRRYWNMTELSGAAVEQLFADWDRFRSDMLGFLRSYDVLVTPVDAHPAHRHDEAGPLKFNYTLPYSLAGWPCVVVRAGTSPEGLPIGVQVVARPWREDVAIAVAQELERALGGWQSPHLEV
jgi:amidase